jgi:hypothetical protein
MCSTETEGSFFQAPTQSVAPTSPMPRSAIQTATVGYSRRSQRGFRAGCGTTDQPTSRHLPHCQEDWAPTSPVARSSNRTQFDLASGQLYTLATLARSSA